MGAGAHGGQTGTSNSFELVIGVCEHGAKENISRCVVISQSFLKKTISSHGSFFYIKLILHRTAQSTGTVIF